MWADAWSCTRAFHQAQSSNPRIGSHSLGRGGDGTRCRCDTSGACLDAMVGPGAFSSQRSSGAHSMCSALHALDMQPFEGRGAHLGGRGGGVVVPLRGWGRLFQKRPQRPCRRHSVCDGCRQRPHSEALRSHSEVASSLRRCGGRVARCAWVGPGRRSGGGGGSGGSGMLSAAIARTRLCRL